MATGIGSYYPKVKQASTKRATGDNILDMGIAEAGHLELSQACPTGSNSSVNCWITNGDEFWYGRCTYYPSTDRLRYDNGYYNSTGWTSLATGDPVTVSVAPIPEQAPVLSFAGKVAQSCSAATGGSDTPIDFSGSVLYDRENVWNATGAIIGGLSESIYREVTIGAVWTGLTTGATYRTVTVDFDGTPFVLSATASTSIQPVSGSFAWLGGPVSLTAQHDSASSATVTVTAIVKDYR